ncbi:MAG: hypothetical protein K5Q00_04670, partial [Gammaproteobacteria bacterium]|nr:hypothetical protein [Gammaproteobacteria bacterium]
TTATMAVNAKYIANNASIVTLSMPSSAAVGDQIHVIGKGAGLFTIAAVSSVVLHFGSTAATTSTGTIVSTNQWDALTLECIVANTTWVVRGAQGNYTIT